MSKKLARNGGRGATRGLRAQRYANPIALREATVAHCESLLNVTRADVREWVENLTQWFEEDDQPAQVYEALRMALRNAIRLVDGQPLPDKHGPVAIVRRFVDRLGPEHRGWIEAAEPLPRREFTATRARIVAAWGHRDMWWWHNRKPSIRDLAMLSILAGEFPHTVISPDAPRPDQPTVAKAIEAECRLVRKCLERAGKIQTSSSKADPSEASRKGRI
jgi:hypothetical protein